MSSTLVWEPANRKRADLSTALKWILQKKYGGTINNVVMDRQDLPYLSGLADAGVKGVAELQDAIDKYDEIQITEIF